MSSLNFDIGGLLAMVLIAVMIPHIRIIYTRWLKVIVSVLLLWTIIQSIKYNELSIYYSVFWVVVSSFIICNYYKEEIFYYYEKCTTNLCLIGVVLWILCWIFPFLTNFLISISPNWIHGLEESNILVFGLQPPSYENAIFFRRNCGFAWEPGRFSCIALVALFFNLLRTNCTIKNNKNFWILLVAILSAQSTTGYGILLLLAFFYIYNKKSNVKYLSYLLVIPLAIVIVSLPFMGEKIESLWITDEHNDAFLKSTTYRVENDDQVIVPQRFDGLLWEFYNIIQDPIFGYGQDRLHSFTGRMFSGNVVLYNGVLQIFGIFGIIMGLLYYLLVYRGSCFLVKTYNMKGNIFYLLLFLAINVSYPFILEPLYCAMFLMPFFYRF